MNHQHRRLARYWSAAAGLDGTVIDALRTRRLDHLDVAEPTASELARQLQVQLPVSRAHLPTMPERYWDRDWRREHKGYDESPEDHLWRAGGQRSPRCKTRSTSSRPDRVRSHPAPHTPTKTTSPR